MKTQLQTIPQERGVNFFDPESVNTIQRSAKMFAYSELVPDMYKVSDKNPESKALANCVIALDISNRMGASPLMVMQNLIIIYGRPSWSSKFLISTVNTCGRFTALQYEFADLGKVGKIEITVYEKKWVNGQNGGKGFYKNEAKTQTFDGTAIDNIQCIAFAYERSNKTDKLRSAPISIKMAIMEGWYTKAGSKWLTMPQQMLMYRTASFWTNAYAPELSMGMRTTEEIEDIEYIEVKDDEKVTTRTEEVKEQPREVSLSDVKKKIEKNDVPLEAIEEEPQQEGETQQEAESQEEKPEF